MKSIVLTVLISIPVILSAQSEHRSLIEGNMHYRNKNFDLSAVEFEKVLQVNKASVKGHYNLGNSLYEKNNFDKAIEHYAAAIENTKDEMVKAKAYHNLGNAYARKEKYKEACDAYKSSLRINPTDVETKYNLARSLKKVQPPPPQDNESKNSDEPKNEEEPPKDEIDRMMDMSENEDKKTQENKKNPPSRRRKPEKDW
jgi:Ca-activated chloride channel family protein